MADLGEVSRTLNYHQQRRLGRIQTLIVHVIVPRARRTRLPLLLYTQKGDSDVKIDTKTAKTLQ